MVSIRLMLPHEWHLHREVRLQALLDAPHAFGSSYEAEAKRSNYEWQKVIETALASGKNHVYLYWSSRAGHFYLRIFILQWTHSIVGCMRPFKIVIMNELRDFLFNNVFIHGRSVT